MQRLIDLGHIAAPELDEASELDAPKGALTAAGHAVLALQSLAERPLARAPTPSSSLPRLRGSRRSTAKAGGLTSAAALSPARPEQSVGEVLEAARRGSSAASNRTASMLSPAAPEQSVGEVTEAIRRGTTVAATDLALMPVPDEDVVAAGHTEALMSVDAEAAMVPV